MQQTLKLVNCLAMVLMDEFSNFLNIFCHYAGARSPWSFFIFDILQTLNVNAIQKSLARLKNVLWKPHAAFEGFQ
jgi:hypothetical protein